MEQPPLLLKIQVGTAGIIECQTPESWVEVQMRTLKWMGKDHNYRKPESGMIKFVFTNTTKPIEITTSAERWLIIRLHATLPTDFRTIDNIDDALAGSFRTIAIITDPTNNEKKLYKNGYDMRDAIYELYDNMELAFVAPSIEMGLSFRIDNELKCTRALFLPSFKIQQYPLQCRIGNEYFERNPLTPPFGIACWKFLTAVGDDRFGQLRLAAFGGKEQGCQVTIDSTILPAAELLSQTQSFGIGVLAPGAQMMRYYNTEPCTPSNVDDIRKIVIRSCLDTNCAYAYLVKTDIHYGIMHNVGCRTDVDPITLESHSIYDWSYPGNIAFVPVVNDEIRTKNAVCIKRSDVLRSAESTPAVASNNRSERFYGIPLTLEEWYPDREEGLRATAFVDHNSIVELYKSPLKIFAVIFLETRELDGGLSHWRLNPFALGAMHNQRRMIFKLTPLKSILHD